MNGMYRKVLLLLFTLILVSVSNVMATGIEIYNDLGSGELYSDNYLIDAGNSTASISFTETFSASTGLFAVGFSFESPFSPTEWVLFNSATLIINGTSFDAVDQGNYSQDGVYGQTRLIGLINDIDYNAFFTFDISTLVGSASSATIDINYSNPGGLLAFDVYDVSTSPESLSPTPEPATFLLFGLGILGIAGASRKKQK